MPDGSGDVINLGTWRVAQTIGGVLTMDWGGPLAPGIYGGTFLEPQYPYHTMQTVEGSPSTAWFGATPPAFLPANSSGKYLYWKLLAPNAFNVFPYMAKLYHYIPVDTSSTANRLASLAGDYVSWHWFDSGYTISSGGNGCQMHQFKNGVSYNAGAVGGGNSDPLCWVQTQMIGGVRKVAFRHSNDFTGVVSVKNPSGEGGMCGYSTPVNQPPNGEPFRIRTHATTTGIRVYLGRITDTSTGALTEYPLTSAEVPFAHFPDDGFYNGVQTWGNKSSTASLIWGAGNYNFDTQAKTAYLLDASTTPPGGIIPTPEPYAAGVVVVPPGPVTPANNFRAVDAAQTFGGASSVVVAKNASTVAGDLEIVTIWWDGADKNPPTTPAGWAFVGQSTRVGNSTHVGVFTRTASASDAATTTFAFPEPALGTVSIYETAVYSSYTGVEASSFAKGTGVTVTGTSITTLGTNRALVFQAIRENISAPADPPSGMQERLDSSGWLVDDQNIASASATGTRTFTNVDNTGAAASDSWTAVMLALTPGTVTAPATPSGFTATASSGRVAMAWTANTEPSLQGYVLQRKISGGTYADLVGTSTLTPTTTSYTDLTVVNGTTYVYHLKAVSSGGSSAYTADATVTPLAPPPTPAPTPTGLFATVTNGIVTLTWNSAAGVSFWRVYRKLGTDPAVAIGDSTSQTLSDTPPQPATGTSVYTYYVTSFVGATESTASNTVTANIAAPTPGVIPTADLEQIVLDGLALNTATGAYRIEALELPTPAKRLEWVQGIDADGASLLRDPRYENRTITIRVFVKTGTMDGDNQAIGAITDKLEEAEKHADGLPLVWTPANGTRPFTMQVLSGQVTDTSITPESRAGRFVIATVTMTAMPLALGTEIVGPSTTSASTDRFVTLNLPAIPGDMSALARVVVTDTAGVTRRDLEVGLEQQYMDPTVSLWVPAASLTTSGFSGVTGVTLTSKPTTLAITPALRHIGSYRVKMLATASKSDIRARLAWQAGDGQWTTPRSYTQATWGGSSPSNKTGEVDLGVITIPPARRGSQRWRGMLQAYGPNGGTITVSDLILVPIQEGYVRARAVYRNVLGAQVYADDLQTLGTSQLNSRTGWSAATDFVGVAASGAYATWASRPTVDADLTLRKVALYTAGANMTDSEVSVAARLPIPGVSGLAVSGGPVARYVDANNFLYAEVVGDVTNASTASQTVTIGTVVAGVDTVQAQATIGPKPGTTIRIILVAYASGHTIASFVDATTGAVLAPPIEATIAAAATGGALATGKQGFTDKSRGGTGATRYYAGFAAAIPVQEPVTINAGRAVEVSSSGVTRQDITGAYYGEIAYRGAPLYFPPAGDRGRTARLFVKAHPVDSDVGANNANDPMRVETFFTPRYLVVPR
jgi:hypothetical protein